MSPGWKIARKAVRNAKRNNDINLEARSTLPDFETEDEESESDQSNTENRPVSVASTSALAKPKAQTQTKSNGKGRERHISEAVAGNGAVAAKAQVQESIISPTDPTGIWHSHESRAVSFETNFFLSLLQRLSFSRT